MGLGFGFAWFRVGLIVVWLLTALGVDGLAELYLVNSVVLLL